MRNPRDLVEIAAAGGGLELRAALLSTEILIEIATAAGSSRAQITFHEMMDRPTADLVRIAQAGKGNVVFAME